MDFQASGPKLSTANKAKYLAWFLVNTAPLGHAVKTRINVTVWILHAISQQRFLTICHRSELVRKLDIFDGVEHFTIWWLVLVRKLDIFNGVEHFTIWWLVLCWKLDMLDGEHPRYCFACVDTNFTSYFLE